MATELTPQDLRDLARGAAFLGTGGGGDPYVGRLMVEQALAEGGHLTLISPEEVPDDAFVAHRPTFATVHKLYRPQGGVLEVAEVGG